jgi:tetratricopeptide (TPR) repeat protein
MIRNGFRPWLLSTATVALLVATGSVSAQMPADMTEARALKDGIRVSVDAAAPGASAAPPLDRSVDETDLRALAARFDYKGLDAEIRRLQSANPGWRPPADLFAPKTVGVDEGPLWAAWDRGDLATIRREAGVLKQLNPGWDMPAKLKQLVRGKEMRNLVADAVARENWQAVIDAAGADPGLFGCRQIENLWDLAAARFRTGDRAGAYELYGRVGAECPDADLRLATLQKALANRDDKLIKPLLDSEAARARTPAQEERFAVIKKDWQGNGKGGAAAQIATAEPDPLGEALSRLAKRKSSPDEIEWIERTATGQRNANAATTLGWYHYDGKRFDRAAEWFQQAMTWKAGPKAAEGLVYTYQKLGRDQDARKLAAAWAPRVPKLKAVLGGGNGAESAVAVAYRTGNYAQVLQLTAAVSSGSGDQVLRGWSLMRLDRPAEAAKAFETALAGAAGDRKKEAEAAEGLAQAKLAMGMATAARTVVASHTLPGEKSAVTEVAILKQEALDAYNAGDSAGALRRIEKLKTTAPADRSLAMIEAWSLLKNGRYSEAQRAFQRLHDNYATREAAEGLRIATGKLTGNWD